MIPKAESVAIQRFHSYPLCSARKKKSFQSAYIWKGHVKKGMLEPFPFKYSVYNGTYLEKSMY